MIIQSANLALRFLLELCMLAAFGFLGFHGDQKTWLVKIGLGVGAPLAAAIIWGAFVAPKASFALAAPYRITLEAAIFAFAVGAIYSIGKPVLSAVFVVAYVINRILMYIWNQ